MSVILSFLFITMASTLALLDKCKDCELEETKCETRCDNKYGGMYDTCDDEYFNCDCGCFNENRNKTCYSFRLCSGGCDKKDDECYEKIDKLEETCYNDCSRARNACETKNKCY